MAAASKKFLFDNPEDDYWNQSNQTSSSSISFFDDENGPTASCSFSALRKSVQESALGDDDNLETVDWSGIKVQPDTSIRITPSKPSSTLAPSQLISTASRANTILSPPTTKLSLSAFNDVSPARTGSAASVSSLGDDSSHGKREFTAAEFTRLESEYRKLKLKFEHLRHERYRAPDVKDTIRRLLKGETVVLELYKQKKDKLTLLDSALQVKDGDVILTVVLYLKSSLSDTLFREILLSHPVAANHYVTYLRERYEFSELSRTLFSLGRTEEAAIVEFRESQRKMSFQGKISALNQCLSSGFSDPALNPETLLVSEYRSLLNRQQPIDTSDDLTVREGRDSKFKVFPKAASLLDQPLLTTLYYCSLYHYDLPMESNASPLSLRSEYQLSEKQYCWVSSKALARQRRWGDIEKLLTTKRLLMGPKIKTVVPPEKLVEIMQKHGANADVISKYLRSVADINDRLSLALKSRCHDVATDCYVSNRDRQALIVYASKLTPHTKEAYYAQAALQNANNKWKN